MISSTITKNTSLFNSYVQNPTKISYFIKENGFVQKPTEMY